MSNEITTILLALIGGGGLVAMIQAVASRKKNSAEINKLNFDTAKELIGMARAQYADINQAFLALKIMNERLEEGIKTYKNYCDVLIDFLRKKGISDYPQLNENELPQSGDEDGSHH